LFVTVISRVFSQDLMPASRHQDHTTSPSAVSALVLSTACVHRIPLHVDDVGQRPSVGQDARLVELICPTAKAEYFFKWGWTAHRTDKQSDLPVGQIRLIRLNNSAWLRTSPVQRRDYLWTGFSFVCAPGRPKLDLRVVRKCFISVGNTAAAELPGLFRFQSVSPCLLLREDRDHEASSQECHRQSLFWGCQRERLLKAQFLPTEFHWEIPAHSYQGL
jgi:hypothetical protein